MTKMLVIFDASCIFAMKGQWQTLYCDFVTMTVYLEDL